MTQDSIHTIRTHRIFEDYKDEDPFIHWIFTFEFFGFYRGNLDFYDVTDDNLFVHFEYDTRDELIGLLNQLGVKLKILTERELLIKEKEPFSEAKLKKYPAVTERFCDIEQPGEQKIAGQETYVQIEKDYFWISISYKEIREGWKIDFNDVMGANQIENLINEKGLKGYVTFKYQNNPKRFVNRMLYPDLYYNKPEINEKSKVKFSEIAVAYQQMGFRAKLRNKWYKIQCAIKLAQIGKTIEKMNNTEDE